jgi:hypothetical protein
MGSVLTAVALFPLADRLTCHVVEAGQFRLRQRGLPDFFADDMGRSGEAVQGLAHDAICGSVERNSVQKSAPSFEKGPAADWCTITRIAALIRYGAN